MKKENIILLGGVIILVSGFLTFLLGMRNLGVILTLIGVGVYLWDKHFKKS